MNCRPAPSKSHPMTARRTVFSLALAASTLAPLPAFAQATGANAPAEWAPGRFIVAKRAGVSQVQMDQALKPHGGRARRIGGSDLHVVELPAGIPEVAVARLMARHPAFKFAELDYKVRPALSSNDPMASSQWHLARIKTPPAWDAATGAGVTIAIVDTGVQSNHPDLAPNLVAGWNTFDNNSNWEDAHGHGTTTAGTAAAVLNNSTGVAGVAGGAKIMPIRATDANATGYYSTIAAGITYAADRGVRIASASFAWLFKSSTILNAANYMKSKGGLVVVAAGNFGVDEATAATDSVIVASATDGNDALASWSSYGSMVTVAAPGVDSYTTSMGSGYTSMSGTSYATPATAGVLALIMAANPSLSAAQAQNILTSTAVDIGTPGRDIYFGFGRVDADAAVRLARGTTSADSQKPAASVLNPAAGSTVSGLVSVDVAASDNVGVTRVDLLVNGKVTASTTSAPYLFSFDSTTLSGTVSIGAVAYDAAGNAGSASTVSVAVANNVAPDTVAPTVVSLQPADGARLSGTVSIKASATDDRGTAGLFQSLFIDGKQVAGVSGGSLSYSRNTRKATMGAHTITLQVKDSAGNTTTRSLSVSRVK